MFVRIKENATKDQRKCNKGSKKMQWKIKERRNERLKDEGPALFRTPSVAIKGLAPEWKLEQSLSLLEQ